MACFSSKDMAKVYAVDENMLRRTQSYLLGQRDGKGGFKRNPRSIDSFGRAPTTSRTPTSFGHSRKAASLTI